MLNCCCTNCCCENFIYISLLIVCIVFAFVAIYNVCKSFSAKVFVMCCSVFLSAIFLSSCYTCWFYDHFIAIATFLITAIGIIIAVHTLDDSKKTAEAQIIDKYNDKYFENDMYDALTSLWKVHKEHSDWFLPVRLMSHNDSFSISLKDENIENLKALLMNEKIDKDRRIVKRYFLNAYEMNRQGFISEKVLLEIIDKEGIKAFFCIVEPLELAKNKNYNYEPFFGIMEVCRKNKGTHFKCLNKK